MPVSSYNMMNGLDASNNSGYRRRSRVDSFDDEPYESFTSRLPLREMPVDYNQEEIDIYWETKTEPIGELRKKRVEWARLEHDLGMQAILPETFTKFRVRATGPSADELDGIVFPRFRYSRSDRRPMERLKPSSLKIVSYYEDTSRLEVTVVENPRVYTGMFGWHLVGPDDRKVVITLDEMDAMAVYQGCNRTPALCLPSSGDKIDYEVLPYLEDFDLIYIWFPPENLPFARLLGHKLEGWRCNIIETRRRPREMLQDVKLRKTMGSALAESTRIIPQETFSPLATILPIVKEEIVNHKKYSKGIAQWKRFGALNPYLVGFRPGELTVLTGATGIGKTTFLCEYVVDLREAGVNTLFCSFEMSDVKIVKWMIMQFSKIPLWRIENHGLVDRWMDKFESMPGMLLSLNADKYLNKRPEELIQAIRTQVRQSGVQHVVLDNLQFMIGTGGLLTKNSLDRWALQDYFVSQFRRLATETQAHVTLVVHPRKEPTGEDLTVNSFYGGGRVTQEADTVLIVQRRKKNGSGIEPRKFLHIVKNRFGQELVEGDHLELKFDRHTYCHTLLDLKGPRWKD